MAPLHTNSGSASSLNALASYDTEYRWMLGVIRNMANAKPETRLLCVEQLARFTAACHTGRFADGALEQIAIQIGDELSHKPVDPREFREFIGGGVPARSGRRRVLHVATQM